MAVKVPGLTLDGGVNPSSTGHGYLLLAAKSATDAADDGSGADNADSDLDEIAERKVVRFFEHHCVFELVDAIRLRMFGWRRGQPVPPELQAAVYSDGAGWQVRVC